MPDLSTPRRAPCLIALVSVAALVSVMCTRAKSDEDAASVTGDGGPECRADDPRCVEGVAGENDAGQLAVGAAGCASGKACSSGVCMPDVDGTRRCCEGECSLDSGRVCSTAGECVCSMRHQEIGGLCLLENGQACRDGSDCASSHCADGVCCNAACDRICERCDAVGACVLHSEDPSCVEETPLVCTARNRCRLLAAQACRSDVDCESDHCEPALSGQSICCATECSGVCARCGASGVCGFPPSDPECPPVAPCQANTTCLAHRFPTAGECSGSGDCAECERLPTRSGIPCGVGAQCDGDGECRVTDMGRVAAGTRHTCAIRDNGNVRCWGSNDSGQLGADIELPFVGDDEDPARVSNLEIDFGRDVVQVTAGFGHTCVLFEGEDGKVRCWGRVVGDQTLGTVVGLLGTDDVELNRLGFVNPLMTGDVRLSEPAVQISAASGDAHTCALLASGKVSCWGINDRGQCGIGNRSASVGGASNEVLPTIDLDPNDPDMRAVQVSAGDGHTCALLSKGGRVTCWGLGSNGRLGYGDNSDRLAPRDSVAIGEPALQIAAGSGHTCALLERGRVRCWGDNTDGVLGYGHDVDIGDDETPEQAVTMLRSPNSSAVLGGDARIGGAGVVQITAVADTNAMCARFASGVVRCWGQNGRGQLGYGHTETLGAQFPPEALYYRSIGTHFAGGDVPLGGLAVALAGGGRCALVRPEGASTSTARSSLYCWGTNSDAQLGLPAAFTIGSHTRTPVELGPVFWEE